MKNIKRKQIKELGECFVDSIQKGKTKKTKTKTNLSACWWFVLCLSCLLALIMIAVFVIGLGSDKVVAPEQKLVGKGLLLAKNATISFYSELDSCHTGKSCLMANGKRAERGYIACPSYIPLGTKVIIDGLLPNYYECGDRTAKWVDGRWDIFLGGGIEAYNEAKKRGLEYHDVYLIIENYD